MEKDLIDLEVFDFSDKDSEGICVITISPSSPLEEARNQLREITENRQFKFVNSKGLPLLEKNKTVEKAVHDSKLYIKYTSKELNSKTQVERQPQNNKIKVLIFEFDNQTQQKYQILFQKKESIQKVREAIQKQSPSKIFSFVTKTGAVILEENRTVGQTVMEDNKLYIRFGQDKSLIDKQTTKITVANFENKSQSFELSVASDTLSTKLKEMIEEHNGMKVDILRESGEVLLGQFKIRDIMTNGRLYYKRNVKKQAEQRIERNKTQKQKNMKILKDLQDDLDKFEKKHKDKQKEFKNDPTLDTIKKRLEQINPTFKLYSRDEIVSNMINIKEDLSAYMKTSQQFQPIKSQTTLKDLVSNFNQICQGHHEVYPTNIFNRVVNFEQTNFSFDNQNNGIDFRSQSYSSSDEYESHKKTWEKTKHDAQLNVAACGVFWAVKSSTTFSKGEQSQTFKGEKKMTKTSYSHVYGYYCGGGINITKNQIVLDSEVVNQFWKIFDLFVNEDCQKSQDIDNQIKSFFQNYGYEIEIGAYYFGGYFELTIVVQFKSQQTTEQATNISNLQVGSSLSAGGVFSAFAAAGNATYGHNSQNAKKQDSTKISSIEDKKESCKSVPATASSTYQEWKHVVSNSRDGWIVLDKKVKKHKLLQILLSGKNIPIKYQAQGRNYAFFKKYCERIYQEQLFAKFPQKRPPPQDVSGWKIYLPDIGNYLYYPLNSIRLGNSKFYQEQKGLKTIPAAVTTLSYIKELNLCNNFIKVIQNLQRYTELQTLDLSQNQIIALNGLSNLKKLQRLNLSNNKIDLLTQQLLLPSITKIDLYHNPAIDSYLSIKQENQVTTQLRQRGVYISLRLQIGYQSLFN